MNIDSIKNGIVIDHITAGKAMKIYDLLGLDKLECSVALIRNVTSKKMGKKDIIKVDYDLDIDTDVLGYIDPDATINVIKNGVIVDKKTIELPEKLTNVVFCKNPRCICTTEQELPSIFTLTDRENRVYRCLYCETKAAE
ncbi:MAG: aspartate carbamoyltransferase regulatory subunit [Acutalibacteraceae bacterium]|nr:aspartate carbamoyltransferase regulatory subunit [Acutalibacteraceae bacterium]